MMDARVTGSDDALPLTRLANTDSAEHAGCANPCQQLLGIVCAVSVRQSTLRAQLEDSIQHAVSHFELCHLG